MADHVVVHGLEDQADELLHGLVLAQGVLPDDRQAMAKSQVPVMMPGSSPSSSVTMVVRSRQPPLAMARHPLALSPALPRGPDPQLVGTLQSAN